MTTGTVDRPACGLVRQLDRLAMPTDTGQTRRYVHAASACRAYVYAVARL